MEIPTDWLREIEKRKEKRLAIRKEKQTDLPMERLMAIPRKKD